jgi:hypothetical protein
MNRVNGLWTLFSSIPIYILLDEIFRINSWTISLTYFGESILFRCSLYLVGIGAIIAGFHHNPDSDDSIFLHNLILLGLGGCFGYVAIVPWSILQTFLYNQFWGIFYWTIVFIAGYVFVVSILIPMIDYSRKYRTKNNGEKTPQHEDPNQTYIFRP